MYEKPSAGDLTRITVSLTSSYHLQSNRQVKRLNQELGLYLCNYCCREQQHCSKFLPWAEYATHSHLLWFHNIPVHAYRRYQTSIFPWSGEPSDVQTVDDWFHQSQEVWESTHVHLQRAIQTQHIQPSRPNTEPSTSKPLTSPSISTKTED